MQKPSYIRLFQSGELRKRADRALELLNPCRLCPRNCGVNRLAGQKGFCGTGRKASVASYHPHFGEEAPLVGRSGSGTIFFCGCNLRCSFCQNYEISHLNEGSEANPEQLAEMMLSLAGRGCHNINLVTPTHVAPQILEALAMAVEGGLDIPLVYNSGGYDRVETLRQLEDICDIYMPDFKFWDTQWSEKYCQAPNYREQAISAIREMHRQVGDLQIDITGIAFRGLLVRHLVMPNGVAGTGQIMRFLASQVSPNTYVNVMAQYRPCGQAYGDATLGRPLSGWEMEEALALTRAAGITRLD